MAVNLELEPQHRGLLSGTAQSILWYGASGTFKTTQIVGFALYVHARTGRRTRLVSAETAGVEPLGAAIESGIIEPLWFASVKAPRAKLLKLARGMWPYKGNLEDFRDTTAQEWAGIGGYAFEGLMSIAEVIRLDLMSRQSAGAKSGEDRTGLMSPGYAEDGETFGSSSLSQYGAVQDDMLRLLKSAPQQLYTASGGMIDRIAFTAHEAKGGDDVQGKAKTIYGPGTVGKAIVDKIPKEVGTMFHCEESVLKDPANPKVDKREVRYYFLSHPDNENPNILWQAKPRIPPVGSAVLDLKLKWPNGYFLPTVIDAPSPMGVREFLQWQDQAQAKAAEMMKARTSA